MASLGSVGSGFLVMRVCLHCQAIEYIDDDDDGDGDGDRNGDSHKCPLLQ